MARKEPQRRRKPMRTLSMAAAALVIGLFSQGASAACYVVYAADQTVVYRAPEPPVDLSRPCMRPWPRSPRAVPGVLARRLRVRGGSAQTAPGGQPKAR